MSVGLFTMKAAMNSQFTVEQFNGKGSFTLWQRRVKDILVQQGLAKALKGKEKPEGMKADEWEDLESRCVSTIRLCVADNIINNVMDEDSAAGLWEKLEKLYLAKSLTNKLHLKRQLYRLKMEDGGNLMEHMNLFNGFLDQLKRVDVKIEEEDKALLLLTSLPDSYDNLVTTLLYGKDTVSLEQVEASLVSHYTQKKTSSNDGGGDSTLAVASGSRGRSCERSGGGNRHRSGSRRRGVQCYECKDFGHIRKYCPHRKGNDGGDKDSGDKGSLVLLGDDGDVLTVSEGKHTISRDDWILDSGCTNHVCSKREYFNEFQKGNLGKVSLGDGSSCKIMGVGTVRIKMSDGAVRTLGGVRYVPKMRRNLISLSRMDSMGCKISVAGGAMKITRGCMVLMKGEKCGGLYRLVGSTVNNSIGNWVWRARDNGYPRRVSFAVEAKTHVFQGVDDCEGNVPIGGGGGSRPRSGVNG